MSSNNSVSKRNMPLASLFFWLFILGSGYYLFRHFTSTKTGTIINSRSRNQFAAKPSYASTYYVSPRGSDSNDGASDLKPLLNIDKALSFAEAGNTVVLADGDYEQSVSTLKDGRDGAPITIKGSRRAVIRGTAKENRIMEIRNSYISLVGFTVDGLSGAGQDPVDFKDKLIYVIGSAPHNGVKGLKITDMLVQNAGAECVRLRYFVEQAEVSATTIKHCGAYDFIFSGGTKHGEGIYLGTAPEQRADGKNPDAAVDESNSNYIHDNFIETFGNECVDIKEGAHDNLVENNDCGHQMDPESGGFDARGNNNTFRHNTIHDNKGAGVRLGGDEVTDGQGNSVYDNSIANSAITAIKILRLPQGKICGNTLSNNGDPDNVKAKGIDPASACGN